MGFKTGVIVGFGVGYVLGTRAGRERFEELKETWNQFIGNPQVQSVVAKGRDVVDAGTEAGIRAVGQAADNVKGRLESDEDVTGGTGS